MKKLLLIAGLYITAALSAFSMPSALALDPHPLEVGKTVDTELKLNTLGGKIYKLSDLDHPVVALHFWASWCPPCVVEFPKMLDGLRGMDGDIGLVAISLDHDAAAMQRFMDKLDTKNVPIYWVHDSTYQIAVRKILIGSLPETAFLNRDGLILKQFNEHYEWDSGAAWKEMTGLVAEAQ